MRTAIAAVCFKKGRIRIGATFQRLKPLAVYRPFLVRLKACPDLKHALERIKKLPWEYDLLWLEAGG